MILAVILGVGVDDPDASYLQNKAETNIAKGAPTKDNVGIIILKCGHHREQLPIADKIIQFGECSSAPPDAEKYPGDVDKEGTIMQVWESMMQEETEVEGGTEMHNA